MPGPPVLDASAARAPEGEPTSTIRSSGSQLLVPSRHAGVFQVTSPTANFAETSAWVNGPTGTSRTMSQTCG